MSTIFDKSTASPIAKSKGLKLYVTCFVKVQLQVTDVEAILWAKIVVQMLIYMLGYVYKE